MSRPYDLRRWRRIRAQQLVREPLCRTCQSEGHFTMATQVDHIQPIAAGGAFDDFANLQSLCHEHHSMKTRSEQTGRQPRPRAKINPDTGLPQEE